MMPKTLLEPRVFNRSTSRLVYPAAWYSWPKLFESSVLCRQHGFKATSSFRAGLPNNHGPFKLARIASHFHSGLCNKNISAPNLLLAVDCVGNRRVSTNLSPEEDSERRCSRSEEHTSELQSHSDLVCRLLLEKKNKNVQIQH